MQRKGKEKLACIGSDDDNKPQKISQLKGTGHAVSSLAQRRGFRVSHKSSDRRGQTRVEPSYRPKWYTGPEGEDVDTGLELRAEMEGIGRPRDLRC